MRQKPRRTSKGSLGDVILNGRYSHGKLSSMFCVVHDLFKEMGFSADSPLKPFYEE